MMIQKKCPLATVGLPYCKPDCAWYNPGTDQCAIFGIFDQTADVAQRIDYLRDVIEKDVIKVLEVHE